MQKLSAAVFLVCSMGLEAQVSIVNGAGRVPVTVFMNGVDSNEVAIFVAQ
jgi:hypothetical protein